MFSLQTKTKLYKRVALGMAFLMAIEVLLPVPAAYALTGGPSQPEVQSFEPVGTSEMVNVFSGDFTYNIPLIDVGGYPVNLSYNAGPTTDQEASWVGLGWNINPGVINRNMRSLPDDFKGDEIVKEKYMKPNLTYGVTLGIGAEIYGLDFLKLNVGTDFHYNNYTGVGFGFSINPSMSINASSSTEATVGVGFSASSSNGVDVEPSLGFGPTEAQAKERDYNLSGNVGLSVNSREGLKSLALGVSYGKGTSKGNSSNRSQIVNDAMNGSNYGGNLSYSFTAPTHVPQAEFPMTQIAGTFNSHIGGEVFGVDANGSLRAYYSKQMYLMSQKTFNGYGYLYSEFYDNDVRQNSLHDFNREKDSPFNKKYSTNLAVTNFTYDVYSVSGQGIGGIYRPYRNDIGAVHDPLTISLGSGSLSLGGEVGLGNALHFGTDINAAVTLNMDGKWEISDKVGRMLKFRGKNIFKPDYEPVYFKQAGELNVADEEFIDYVGGYEAFRPDMKKVGIDYFPVKKITNGVDKGIHWSNERMTKKERQPRNQNISFLTASEASYFAFQPIRSYPVNTHTLTSSGYGSSETIARIGNGRKEHHISEVSVLRPDGARYYYGIPAYNFYQREATFSIQNGNPDCATGLVDYNAGSDNSTGNRKGLENYFESNTMPAYAHSYMLTSIVSSDYVDLTSDGPSDDDFGSYTKFNYSRINNYQWRVPFQENKANYNEVLKTNRNGSPDTDDKASYVYGKKELWYVHSIETRTHVAEFILEDRLDGQGVKDENGGLDTDLNAPKMKRLVRIELYSKRDKLTNPKPTPIKVVHFEYDYSLCTGIENSSSPSVGKLTLKHVYFTYGNSYKGKMNAYTFNYDGDKGNANFNYNMKAYDRWGNYKPNDVSPDCGNPGGTPLTTSEYPYVEQDDTAKTNLYARAWSMTSIELPSGGKIEIDYEADDYAYVQDRPAMQMFKIVGTSKDSPYSISNPGNPVNNNPLMEEYGAGNATYRYMYFELPVPIKSDSLPTVKALKHLIKRDYIKNMGDLYFRFLVNLQSGSTKSYEYVSGYGSFHNEDGWGVVTTNDEYIRYGYIRLEEAGIKLNGEGDRVHPISQAAWQFTRLYLPRVAFEQNQPSDEFNEAALKALAGAFTAVKQFAVGFNRSMAQKNYGKEFVKDKSWIRLYNPTGKKIGGGHRVKRIILNDQWNKLTGNSHYENSTYGQEYDYTTVVNVEGKNRVISSGVAAYEPLNGGDENPFRTPVFMTQSLRLAPSTKYYLEEPFGESFFPGASVGYSKITVRNLQFKNVKEGLTTLGSVNKNATGKVVHEFYTAKDFPTITRRTGIDSRPSDVKDILRLFKLQVFDFMNITQGYMVELNDMHGKPKAQWVYAEGNEVPISGVEYKYRVKTENKTTRVGNQTVTQRLEKLNNQVDVMSKYPGDKNEFIKQKTVGVDMDVVTDLRYSKTATLSGGVTINMDLFLAAAFPVTVPTGYPSFAAEFKSFGSSVMTKVVNRYGILEKTIAHDLGASVSTENILWDAETGEVLLTKTSNQFGDPVYNFTYPAHWAYDRMGPSYKNTGVEFLTAVQLNNIPQANKYFAIGDEVVLRQSGNYINKVYAVQTVGNQSISLKDRSGNPPDNPNGFYTMKVLRSGRRNMQATSVGSVTTLKNPMVDSDGDNKPDRLDFSQVLNAGAVEYKDYWATFCSDCGFNPSKDFNPYSVGLRGLWRPNKNWVYLTERLQSVANDNTDIRRDGVYASYVPFWMPPANQTTDWSAPNKDKWQYVNQITHFSPFGYEVENKDALGRYSAALYGYNNAMSTAVGNNAQYRELAFDGFEDYGFGECEDDHFSYRKPSSNYTVISTTSHTGRKSLRVTAGQSAATKRYIK